jgi:hypothetical protein
MGIDRGNDLFQHKGISTDIPTRIETYAGMNCTDAADAFKVFCVKPAADNPHPVGCLCGLRARQLLIAIEKYGRGGCRFKASVEAFQRSCDALSYNRGCARQGGALPGPDLIENEPAFQFCDGNCAHGCCPSSHFRLLRVHARERTPIIDDARASEWLIGRIVGSPFLLAERLQAARVNAMSNDQL